MNEDNKNEVFQFSGVVQFVFWLGKPAIIKENEIEAMKTYLAYPIVKIDIDKWFPNANIQINEGLYKNHFGVVKKALQIKLLYRLNH